MEKKKFLLSASVLAVVALAAAANVFAQSSCNSKTTSEGTGNFVVNVTQQTHLTTQGVRRTYTYTISSPTGKNPNKLFIFVDKGLNGDLTAINGGGSPGTYLTPDNFAANNTPPAAAWNVVHHEDGVGWTTISLANNPFTLDVSERYKPAESLTTVLIGISSTFEHCGPIFGPTTPAPPEFQGSPLVQTVSTKTFANGCIYDVVAGETDQNIISMTLNPNSPAFETVFSGTPQPCQVVPVTLGTCEADTGLVFCPVLKLGQPPIQKTAGGTCYYPTNIKFTC